MSVVDNATFNAKPAADEEKCLPWSLSQARVTTVSIARLKIPPKARREYEMACDAFNKNKFEDAEKHARGATEKLQEYSAAWVMLGVILEAQKKVQEARDACSRAATIDVTYLPAYLCGAAISARNGEWQEALNFADQALGLQSEGNAYGHFYRATAYLHMNNLVEAKKSALQAVAIDVNHDEPSLCLLLAEVYDREGDTVDAIAQLQQFLKRRTDRRQEDAAKRFLARLEAQQPAN